MLWYGDPGPSKMVNRHAAAAAPVSINGRLFVQGDESIMAYDAYNGLFLWELENPGAFRMALKRGYEPGNLIASEDSVFNVVGDECWHIDAASGQIKRKYHVPDTRDDRQWGYVAYADGRLFGTSGRRETRSPGNGRRRRPKLMTDTDRLFLR